MCQMATTANLVAQKRSPRSQKKDILLILSWLLSIQIGNAMSLLIQVESFGLTAYRGPPDATVSAQGT